MRKVIKMPRILKINAIRGLSVSVTFNNGESRIIDFEVLLKDIGVEKGTPAAILLDSSEFKKMEICNHTLSWPNVEQYIVAKGGGRIRVPFEIGADVLLKHSTPDTSENVARIGTMVREARRKSGLSQKELALVSGTSRTYISRIENDRSDVELATLRKIIETGLGRKLEICIK